MTDSVFADFPSYMPNAAWTDNRRVLVKRHDRETVQTNSRSRKVGLPHLKSRYNTRSRFDSARLTIAASEAQSLQSSIATGIIDAVQKILAPLGFLYGEQEKAMLRISDVALFSDGLLRISSELRNMTVAQDKLSPVDTLSENAIQVIGKNGVDRLHAFSRLTSGWDGLYSQPLQAESVINFNSFMMQTGFSPHEACIFMTREGNVVLNWLAPVKKVNELEFSADHLAYYSEETGDELVNKLNQYNTILDAIKCNIRRSIA
ncbi:MAG: hypothetical protein ACYDC7_03535 [Acidithiobacillus ferrivorans]